MVFNETQAQEPKPAIESADKSKDIVDKAWEMVPQNLKDNLSALKMIALGQDEKEEIGKNSGNHEYASMTADAVKESRDASTLKEYMKDMTPESAAKIPPETQLKLLEAANSTYNSHSELSNPINGYRNFDDSTKLYESISKLPEAQQKMVQEYKDALANGQYQNSLPGSVRGFPEDVQREIYKNRPKVFARSFPDSKIVEGEVLQDLVKQEVDGLKGTPASQLKYSNIGRENSLLKNPNISKQQLNDIAVTFLDIKYGDSVENKNFFEATESIIKVCELLNKGGCFSNEDLSKKYEDKFGYGINLHEQIKKEEAELAETRAYWAQHESKS